MIKELVDKWEKAGSEIPYRWVVNTLKILKVRIKEEA